MNERIKELYEQSLSRVNKTDHDGNPVLEIHQDPEKFAELIVNECASKVDWILAEGGKTQGDLIKEHFGVEE